MNFDDPPPSNPSRLPSTYDIIPEPHYAAIGKAVATWADFEVTVDRAIWKLMGVEQVVGACVTAQFGSVFSRLNALASLSGLRSVSEEVKGKLTKLKGSLGSLSDRRNRIVHDARFKRPNGTIIRFEVVAKSTLRFDWTVETVAILEAFCLDVDQAREEFLTIWRKIATEIERQPQKLQGRFPRIVMSDLELLTHPDEEQ